MTGIGRTLVAPPRPGAAALANQPTHPFHIWHNCHGTHRNTDVNVPETAW